MVYRNREMTQYAEPSYYIIKSVQPDLSQPLVRTHAKELALTGSSACYLVYNLCTLTDSCVCMLSF